MKKSLMLGVLVLAIVMVAGVSSAFADSVTTTGTLVGGHLTSVDTVTVKAAINPKLVLTVVTPAASQTVDFGTLDPGTVTGTQPVSLTVQSNKLYSITVAKAGDTTIGLNTTLANSVNNAKTASQAFTDNYSLNVPWTTDPGSYSATVQYTVVQN
jgi:hypothetical protein